MTGRVSVRRGAWYAALLMLLGLPGCGASAQNNLGTSNAVCVPYKQYTGHSGATVSMFGPIRDTEAEQMTKAWDNFQVCTGINIDYEGSDSFEKALLVRVIAKKAPDLAIVPQPGLLSALVRQGAARPASAPVQASVTKYWSVDWRRYGTVNGTLYAAPMDANVKSLVWYSPKYFAAHGYRVPQTWAQMLALSDQIAAGGIKPWCAGIESGDATGWPVTDWLEDTLLRTSGPAVYDAWVAHKIPFGDSRVVAALTRVGQILRNPAYVNGGYGGVASIATTAFQEGGLPIMEGKCAMHRQASFYTNWWPHGADISEHGDVWAFYLPPVTAGAGRPVLGAGDFTVALSDAPAVAAVAAFLASPEFANGRARSGGVITANSGLDPSNLQTAVQRMCAHMLSDPGITFRFDGSDMMPAVVGAGTFWTQMTAWIKGEPTVRALKNIDASWPAS